MDVGRGLRLRPGTRLVGHDLPLRQILQDVHEVGSLQDPEVSSEGGRTTWMLSRPTDSTIALKVRYEPTDRPPTQRTHPGRDWLFVTEGRVRLLLGAREIIVERGEAAEFSTMTPHSISAIDRPAELVMVFDRDGHRAHLHNESTH